MSAQSGPHLLIIDDDERIRTLLKSFLQRNGFLVTAARDAAHARRLLAGLEFSLIVMDVMMPGEDGLSLTQDLRKTITTPILLLTARSETRERIEGLQVGADDYLPKPFDPRELLLRLNAILRRVPDKVETGPKFLGLGQLRYDRDSGELWSGQNPVRLTATEMRLMRILSTRAGQVVSRAELTEELDRDRQAPEDGTGSDRAVDVQITRLRRKIEPDPREPRYLQTVRGLGYMLAPD